jgi:hypothetical protein
MVVSQASVSGCSSKKAACTNCSKVSITLTRPGEEKQEVLFQPRKTI